ncbi:MAG: hypothetical protein ABIE03_02120 [Patescibacteria group bacterium]|nr:hypothetical protein [Patescibacteria group bacterium]
MELSKADDYIIEVSETGNFAIPILIVRDLRQALQEFGFEYRSRLSESRDIHAHPSYIAKSGPGAYRLDPAFVEMVAETQEKAKSTGLPILGVVCIITDRSKSIYVEERFISLEDFRRMYYVSQKIVRNLCLGFIESIQLSEHRLLEITNYGKLQRDTGIVIGPDGNFRLVHTDESFYGHRSSIPADKGYIDTVAANLRRMFREGWDI